MSKQRHFPSLLVLKNVEFFLKFLWFWLLILEKGGVLPGVFLNVLNHDPTCEQKLASARLAFKRGKWSYHNNLFSCFVIDEVQKEQQAEKNTQGQKQAISVNFDSDLAGKKV